MKASYKFTDLLSLGMLLLLLLAPRSALAIDPVRPGDKIEVHYLGQWRPGEVVDYKKGQALVRYMFARETEGLFKLEGMRFPNEEGSWMIWRDATGKFQIEARLIGRTATHVKLIKVDGTTLDVPIEKLADNLKAQLAKVAQAEKKFVDAAFVRVGDQVELNYWSTWYPATVKKILPEGALVEYVDGSHTHERDAKYKDLRYPNGEGPWADWVDVSGEHKVKARYITHDETHVELLIEGGKRVRMQREKLAKSIETELAKRAVLTRRPDEVEFDMSRVDYENVPSWMNFGTKLPENSLSSLNLSPAKPTAELEEGTFEVTLPVAGKVDAAILVGGDANWIALGVTPEKRDEANPVSLQWVDPKSKQLMPGPNFFEGELILGYSAEQQRLLTAEGLDLRGSATRFCTYRLAPGQSKAKPEWKWSVPKISFFSSSNNLTAAFVGSDRILIGYGGTVTLWNMNSKVAEYVVPSTNSEINLSPDQQYFFTNQFSHAVVVDVSSGNPVANLNHKSSAKFSDDGRYVFSSGSFDSSFVDLRNPQASIALGSLGDFGSGVVRGGGPTIIDGKWVSDGGRLWDLERKLLTWSYNISELQSVMQRMVGDKLLAIGHGAGANGTRKVHVAVTKIPSSSSIGSISNVTEEQLYILRRGIGVKIDSSARHPKMLPGIQRALAAAEWREDPASEIVISASSQRGESVTNTYSSSRYGASANSQTITVSPWIQSLKVEYRGAPLWNTGSGGAPSFLMVRENESVTAEVQKCEIESYSLFENIRFPDKVLAPKWRNGFGTTSLTSTGLIERPVTP